MSKDPSAGGFLGFSPRPSERTVQAPHPCRAPLPASLHAYDCWMELVADRLISLGPHLLWTPEGEAAHFVHLATPSISPHILGASDTRGSLGSFRRRVSLEKGRQEEPHSAGKTHTTTNTHRNSRSTTMAIVLPVLDDLCKQTEAVTGGRGGGPVLLFP